MSTFGASCIGCGAVDCRTISLVSKSGTFPVDLCLRCEWIIAWGIHKLPEWETAHLFARDNTAQVRGFIKEHRA